jgi:hypothetical protein
MGSQGKLESFFALKIIKKTLVKYFTIGQLLTRFRYGRLF